MPKTRKQRWALGGVILLLSILTTPKEYYPEILTVPLAVILIDLYLRTRKKGTKKG